MNYLQQLYMLILNPIWKFTSRFKEKTRRIILGVVFFCITMQGVFFTTWEKYGIYYGYDRLLLIGTCLFCIGIVFSVENPLKKIKWNKFIYIPWFVCAFLIIITGIHHFITAALLFYGILLLIVFPCFFFVWNNRGDYEILFKTISNAAIAAIMIFFLFNLLLIPHDMQDAYYGLAVNPNSVGLIGVVGVITSLYMVIVSKRLMVYIATAGISVAFIYLSISRASVIAICFVFIVFFIAYIRKNIEIKESAKKTICVIGVIILSVVISTAICKYVLQEITPVTKEIIVENADFKVYAENPQESGESAFVQKFSRGGDLNSFSSGRIEIWKAYLKEMNLYGHDRNEPLFIEKYGYAVSAHNTYIEIGYRCGLLTGICYAWIAIYAAIYSFKYLFKRKSFNFELAMVPMAVFAFGILSNLERALYPFEKIHILLYIMAIAPMFFVAAKEEENNKKLA